MDTTQLEQEKVVKRIEEMLPKRISKQACLERRAVRAQKEEALNCPRCNSTNTKFCYYNNYSLSQPRYLCKTCRRYWTEGGSLRSIRFGGGPSKNKRSSCSSTSSLSVSNKKLPNLVQPPPPQSTSPGPKIHEGNDLNLAFPSHDFEAISGLIQVPNFDNKTPTSPSYLSASALLAGFSSKGMNNSYMPMQISAQNTICPSGFSLQEFKPTLDCSLGGLGSGGCGNLQGLEETSGIFLFPFEDLKKQVSNTSVVERNRKQEDTSGYWNGELGGGSW